MGVILLAPVGWVLVQRVAEILPALGGLVLVQRVAETLLALGGLADWAAVMWDWEWSEQWEAA
jgi:hypothetical protein